MGGLRPACIQEVPSSDGLHCAVAVQIAQKFSHLYPLCSTIYKCRVAVLLNQRALLGRTRIATIIQAWSSP
ncbi:hypothetical protein SLEP1_g17294 [Rubroshorea leprosula]|uniref:Uncharacterized protein n=1 Tax=Rubroshorea leprosula TaxID=152421 RepID=A0AAV5J2V1_9ROSI|nr:hypothetical protein SLEP1_g17294 [Rubroshorea leprosula]